MADVDYLGPNRLPARPAAGVHLGAVTWSGAAPVVQVDGLGMLVLTAGTLTNTGRVPVQVAVQPINGAGTSTGPVTDRTLKAGAHWTLTAPTAAGGWLIVAMTTAGAQALVLGMAAVGTLGLAAAAYGGYAAVRDLKHRHQARRPRAGR